MYILLHQQQQTSSADENEPTVVVPMCRLCATQNLDVSYLDAVAESGRYIGLAIQKYLNIDIADGKDSFTKNVCSDCARRIEEWSQFYSKCHEIQSLIRSTQAMVSETDLDGQAVVEATSSLVMDSVSNHLSKLVEEFVSPEGAVHPIEENHLTEAEDIVKDHGEIQEEVDDETSMTEDEYEDATSDEDEEDLDDEEMEDDEGEEGEAVDGKESQVTLDNKQNNLRHKKFTFTIPFLERKVNRKFNSVERIKLQKHINKRQNTLIYEMLIGGGPNHMWQCQICDKTIKGRSGEVKKHYLKLHQSQPIFPCHVCDYTSRTEKMYQAHRMSHLVEYPCQHCGKVFTQHSRLVYHLNSHTNQRLFECDLCHKKFNTAQYVTTHKRKVHGDQEKLLKYTCELCGMRFKYKNHLQYHQKRHPTDDNPLPYSCKYCDQRFTTRAEQLAHSNTIHAGEGDYVCHLCGKKMKTILSLENHVKLHSGLKEFKCELCGAAFATNHSLKCHRKIHERQDHSYVCPVCKKAMSNKSSLNQHLKTHMGTKPYQCQHCSASFIHKNRLDIHMRKHTGEFPHTCPDCGKGFRSTSSMNSHRQYVHSERKFACSVCNKAFKTSRDLKVHATLHTGEKPNVCPICGKAFRVRANYFKHRKIHMRASNAVVQVSDQADCLLNEPDHMGQTDQEQMVVVPAASGTADFFHFGGDQQWIT